MRQIFNKLFQRQQSDASAPGDNPLRMIASLNLSNGFNKRFPLPAGYNLIDARPTDHPAWITLLDSSGDFGRADAATLESEILSSIIPNGGLLVSFQDQVVACAAVCFAKRFAPNCLLNYVLVRKDHRGKGVGHSISAEAMFRAEREGFSGMVLQTDEGRLAAIAMYKSLGFQPVLDSDPRAPARWEWISEQMQAS